MLRLKSPPSLKEDQMTPAPNPSQRLSIAQRRVISAAKAGGADWIGTDAKNRPVLEQTENRTWYRAAGYRWAVLRNGDPADVAEPVTPIITP